MCDIKSDPLHFTRDEIELFRRNPKEVREKMHKFQGVYQTGGQIGKDMGKNHWVQIIAREDIPQVLQKLYEDPETGLWGINKFDERVKQKYLGITSEDVRQFLRRFESHQVHQGIPKAKVTKPIVVKQAGKYMQIDLSDFSEYKGYNKMYRYILSAVDVHSKYLYARPLLRKTPEKVAEALKDILSTMDNKPSIIQIDNGGEFQGEVSKMLKDMGIKQIFSLSHNPRSQGQIERVQQSIKRLIGRYFTNNNTRRWIDVLDKLVENYNQMKHRTIGKTPEEARDADPEEQRDTAQQIEKAAHKSVEHDLAPLAKGDWVRISLVKQDALQRKLYASGQRKTGSAQHWTKKIYQVESIHQSKRFQRETYKLAGQEGRFYRYSLLKTAPPEEQIQSEKPKKDFEMLDKEYAAGENPDAEAILEKYKGESIADRVKKRRQASQQEKQK